MKKDKKDYFCYDDLKLGGCLSKHVGLFTFFDDYDCNDAFLEMINHTIRCDKGKGICENLVRYSNITVAARKKWNEQRKANENGDAVPDDNINQQDPIAIRGGGDDKDTPGKGETGVNNNDGDAALRPDGGDLFEGSPEWNWVNLT